MQLVTRTRPRYWLAVLALVPIGVGACGGDDASSPTADGPSTSVAPITAPEEAVVEPSGEVTPGGDLVFGLEAETSTGWDPAKSQWAVSGHQVAQSVFDQLATFDADGNAVPYLAESFTPSDDYMEWTIGLRPDVLFHDDTPVNAEAVVFNLLRHKESALTAPTIRPFADAEVVSELEVLVTMSQPWAAFPVVLATQVGYVAAPSQFVVEDEAKLHPIGSGPFVFDEWVENSHFTATRNDNYWRTDAEGTALPYLDSVEFRPIVEHGSRINALQQEEDGLNLMHTTDIDTILTGRALAEAGDVQYKNDGALGEETFFQLNMDAEHLGDDRVRRALAMATDRDLYALEIDEGVRPVASSPFVESSRWYDPVAVDAYPTYDLAGATALIDEYEAENGEILLEVSLASGTANRESVVFVTSLWNQAGVETTLNEVDQATLINDAVFNNYQVSFWRQLGAIDPDGEYHWWDIENAGQPGEPGLNFARNRDQRIRDAMDEARAVPGFEERKVFYDEAQRFLNEDIPYIWLTHTLWELIYDPDVRNVGSTTVPTNEPGWGIGTGFAGAIQVGEIWIDQNPS